MWFNSVIWWYDFFLISKALLTGFFSLMWNASNHGKLNFHNCQYVIKKGILKRCLITCLSFLFSNFFSTVEKQMFNPVEIHFFWHIWEGVIIRCDISPITQIQINSLILLQSKIVFCWEFTHRRCHREKYRYHFCALSMVCILTSKIVIVWESPSIQCWRSHKPNRVTVACYVITADLIA